MNRHSLITHSAYVDLLRSLQDEQASNLRGTPTREIRNGRAYWHDVHRVGTTVRKTYIGEDTPRLADRPQRTLAALLIEALAEDRPDELREAYEDAMERGPQWRAHIGATLKRMPETEARLAAL